MPRGDKSSYTSKQRRKAEHIEEGYERRGVAKKEAERRAWATVNKESGGGKKSGSGRGKKVSHASSRKGGRLGGRAAAKRPYWLFDAEKVRRLETIVAGKMGFARSYPVWGQTYSRKVDAQIVAQDRGKKIIVFKMRRRKNYRRKNGHRQWYTEVKITGIGA